MRNLTVYKFPVYLIVAALITWIGFVSLVWQDHGRLLDWDEVDYVNATRLGILANAGEEGSLSAQEYIKFSLSKINKSQENNYSLPTDYSEEKDPFLLRHFHPPFLNYLLSIVNNTVGTNNEHYVRSVQLFGALILILSIFACYYYLTDQNVTFTGILIISFLSIWMTSSLYASLQYHGWLAVWLVFICWCLTNWLNKDKNGIALVIFLALAVITLETGIFIAFITLAILLISSFLKIKTTTVKQFGIGFILFAGVITVSWVGAVLKISIVKIFGQHLYRFMLGQEYGGATNRFFNGVIFLSPVLIMSVISLFFLIKKGGQELRKWIVFFIIGWLYFLIMLPLSISNTYFLPAVGPLIVFIAGTINLISNKWVKMLVLTLSILALAIAVKNKSQTDSYDVDFRNDLQWVKGKLNNRESFIDGAHIFKFYLGDKNSIKPLNLSNDMNNITTRENGEYKEISKERMQGKILIIFKIRNNFDQYKEKLIPSNCQLYDRLTLYFYDCAN